MIYIRRGILIVFTLMTAIWIYVNVFIISGKDTQPPVILGTEDVIEVSVNATDEELKAGLSASDNVDNDISDKIRVGNHSKFIIPGVCEVEYLVFDSSNNVGKYTRRIVYKDYQSPEFYVKSPLVYKASQSGSPSILSNIGASDVLDGDISDKIKITEQDIDITTAGTYTVTLEVANNYADISTVKLPVHVVDKSSAFNKEPTIQLNQYLVYLEEGEYLNPVDYISEVIDSNGNNVNLNYVDIITHESTSESNVYEIEYRYTERNGATGSTYLIVVLAE